MFDRGKELDSPVECAKKILFILQSTIVSMPILMYGGLCWLGGGGGGAFGHICDKTGSFSM